MNSKKYLLVVMPLYNAKDTVAQAIESILKQTFKTLKLVIVDDASTDGSLEIAKKYLGDNRVSIYQNQINMGAYYSRNYGIFVSKDDDWTHFTTHDADDISFVGRYKSILQHMEKDSRINGLQDMFDRVDTETGKTISSKLTMAHAVFRRDVFDAIGYFDNTRFGGDWEHWRRLKEFNSVSESAKTHGMSKVMGESYIHDTNLTVTIPEGSPKRQKYMARSEKRISKLSREGNLRYEFVPERGMTRGIL